MSGELRIALPNKGVLATGSRQLLTVAGFYPEPAEGRLVRTDHANNAVFLFLRARDIPKMLAGGYVDVGITGRDFVADSGHQLSELLALGFGRSTIRYALPYGAGDSVRALHGKRVATALPSLAARHLADLGIRAEVVSMSGAVESAVQLGFADGVVDVVDSGRTLAAHGLRAVGAPLLVSEAVLVATPARADLPAVQGLRNRVASRLRAADTLSVSG